MQAQNVSGTGGSVVNIPGFSAFSPYFINITSADFTDATHYDNPLLVGRQIEIFAYYIPDYLIEGTDYVRTATGFQIINPTDFDATTTDYRFIVWIQGALTTTQGGGTNPVSPINVPVQGITGNYQFLTDYQMLGFKITNPLSRDIIIGTSFHGNDIFDGSVVAGIPFNVAFFDSMPAGTILYFEVVNDLSYDTLWNVKLYVQ